MIGEHGLSVIVCSKSQQSGEVGAVIILIIYCWCLLRHHLVRFPAAGALSSFLLPGHAQKAVLEGPRGRSPGRADPVSPWAWLLALESRESEMGVREGLHSPSEADSGPFQRRHC